MLDILMRVERARAEGAEPKVFDWNKAARLIIENGCSHASAGLSEDWFWTGACILVQGRPTFEHEPWLGSLWATPVIRIGDDDIPCWIYQKDSNGWDEHTMWPESALKILNKESHPNGEGKDGHNATSS
jgi:hypothetical protein